MKSRKVLFAGCARDCAEFLPDIFSNLTRLSSLFTQSAFICVENDSSDGTGEALASYQPSVPGMHLIRLDGLAARLPQRTLRIAFARNAILEYARQWEDVREFDYVMLLDLDNVSSHPLDLAAIDAALNWMEHSERIAGVFPNQLGTYYDMWALRHPSICPADLWEEVYDYQMANGVSDQEAFDAVFAPRTFNIPVDFPALSVESAFGGLGIYKMQHFLNAPNPYIGSKVKVVNQRGSRGIINWQTCEHVHFHQGLRARGGELYILPFLINGDRNGGWFPASAFRSLMF